MNGIRTSLIIANKYQNDVGTDRTDILVSLSKKYLLSKKIFLLRRWLLESLAKILVLTILTA